jgi:hypothetical protein
MPHTIDDIGTRRILGPICARVNLVAMCTAILWLVSEGAGALSAAQDTPPPIDSTSVGSVSLPPLPQPAKQSGPKPELANTLVVAKLSGGEIKPNDITLYSGFAAASPYRFELRPAANGEWQVFLALPEPANALGPSKLLDLPVAFFNLQYNELSFRWNPTNITRYNPQLANALMTIEDAGTTKTVSLREPDRLPAIQLDLTKAASRIPLSFDPAPEPDTLRIRIDGTDCPEPNLVCSTNDHVTSAGGSLLFNRDDAISTQLEVRLLTVADRTEIRLAAFYKDSNGRRFALVDKDVAAEISAKEKLLQNAEDALADAQSAIPSLESQLSAERASQPQTSQERVQVFARIKLLEGELGKAQGTVRRYSRSVPELRARLDSLKAVAEEESKLADKVRLHASLLATKDGHDLELLTFGELSDP